MSEIVGILIAAAWFIIAPVLGVIGFFKARSLSQELEQRTAQLALVRTRLDELERQIAGPGTRSTTPDDGLPEVSTPTDAEPAKSTPQTGLPGEIPSQDQFEAMPEMTEAATRAARSKELGGSAPSKPVQLGVGGKPRRSLEETVGSLWAVWVGGIALALGAVFLVKFSIERGLLSPLIRVFLGGGFSIALAGAGEWMRRRPGQYSFSAFGIADIPVILTCVGTLGAFASVYAAYELYDLIPPLTAFFALGIVAFVAMAASLLHGPVLAVVGIIASNATPFLVASDDPSVAGLGIYALAVAAAAFGVAWLRLWKWLAIVAALGLVLFAVVIHIMAGPGDRIAVIAYLFAAFVMVAYVFVVSIYPRLPEELPTRDLAASLLVAGFILLFLPGQPLRPADGLAMAVLIIVTALPFVLAWFYPVVRETVYGAVLFAVAGYAVWSAPFAGIDLLSAVDLEARFVEDTVFRDRISTFPWLGLALSVMAVAFGFFGASRSPSRVALAVGGAALPPLVFAIAYVRIAYFAPSVGFCLVAFLGFLALLVITNYLRRIAAGTDMERDAISAALTTSALVFLALSVSVYFERGVLTLALALLVPIVAAIYNRTPLAALRPLAVIAALLWIGRVAWDPAIVGDDLGTMPVFNWLLLGYGVPTAGFAFAAWLFGTAKRDYWLEILEAITISSLAATIALLALHGLAPKELFTAPDTLGEAALLTMIGGGIALGLLRLGERRSGFSVVWGATVLGIAGMAIGAFGLLVAFNPLLSGEAVEGGFIWNLLLFAYLAAGILYLALGHFSANRRPAYYANSALMLGASLVFAYVSLTIRLYFHPIFLDQGSTGENELYTYSAVWLGIAVTLLALGIRLHLKWLRQVSVALVALVVVKVFLVDMAGLEGILRALSFIGLGAALVGIGLVYQRVLSAATVEENTDTPSR